MNQFFNKINDQKSSWFPLSHLKPQKHELIKGGVILRLTFFYGVVTGMLVALMEGNLNNALAISVDILKGWIAFYLFFKFTFARAWNERAKLTSTPKSSSSLD